MQARNHIAPMGLVVSLLTALVAANATALVPPADVLPPDPLPSTGFVGSLIYGHDVFIAAHSTPATISTLSEEDGAVETWMHCINTNLDPRNGCGLIVTTRGNGCFSSGRVLVGYALAEGTSEVERVPVPIPRSFYENEPVTQYCAYFAFTNFGGIPITVVNHEAIA